MSDGRIFEVKEDYEGKEDYYYEFFNYYYLWMYLFLIKKQINQCTLV